MSAFLDYAQRPSAELIQLVELYPINGSGPFFLADAPYVTEPEDAHSNTIFWPVIERSLGLRRAIQDIRSGGRTTSTFDWLRLASSAIAASAAAAVDLATVALDGATAKIELVGPRRDVPYTEDNVIQVAEVGRSRHSSEGWLELELRDPTARFDRVMLPPGVISATDYPDAPAASLGKPIPLHFGRSRGVAGILIKATTEWVYLFGEGPYQAISNVCVNGAIAAGVTVDAAAGTATFTTKPVGPVTADVEGKVDNGIWLSTTAQVMAYLAGRFGGAGGPDVVANGSFDANIIDGWGGGTNATWDAGRAKMTATASSAAYLGQDLDVTPGRLHRLVHDVEQVDGDSRVYIVDLTLGVTIAASTWSGANLVTGQGVDFIPAGNQVQIRLFRMYGSVGDTWFDNITVFMPGCQFDGLPTGVIGYEVKGAVSLGAALTELAKGCLAWWGFARSGDLITRQIATPAGGGVTVTETQGMGELTWESEPLGANHAVTVTYRPNHTQIQTPAASVDAATQQWLQGTGLQTQREITPTTTSTIATPIKTFFDAQADAEAIGDLYLSIFGVERRTGKVLVPYGAGTFGLSDEVTVDGIDALVIEVNESSGQGESQTLGLLR